jgi:hypothetical protein
VATRLCAGGSRDVGAVLIPLQAAHDARASELETLIVGSTKRALHADSGERLKLEELPRHPACTPSFDALVQDRVARALDAFFNKKEARLHRDRRGMVAVDIGCEEAGTLLVSLSLGIGVGESVHATYRVDEKRAPPIVDGPALAHADLDGDGQRDVVWTTPDGHLAVRFADRTLTTPLKVPESEDTDFFLRGRARARACLRPRHRVPRL